MSLIVLVFGFGCVRVTALAIVVYAKPVAGSIVCYNIQTNEIVAIGLDVALVLFTECLTTVVQTQACRIQKM